MSRKRLIIIFLSVLALVIIITGADMFLKSNQEKQNTTKIADDYLIEHNLTENVQTKETVYNSWK